MISLYIATVLLCCSAGDFFQTPILLRDPVHIAGGYSLGRPLGCDLELYEPGYFTAIEQAVVKIGWDEEFILVEQHPRSGWIVGEPDSSNPRWHIIVVSTGKHFSWRSYDDSLFLRDVALRVPDTIEMRDAREVYDGG